GSPTVFRIVVAEDELKLLHAFLRNGGANTVDGVVDSVGAIYADHVGTGASAVDVEAGIRCGANGGRDVASGLRIGEREIDVVAAVDGEIVDAALLDGLRDFGLGGLDRSGFGGHGDCLLDAPELHGGIEFGVFADGECDGRGFEVGEVAGAVDFELVNAGRDTDEAVIARVIGNCGALGAGGFAGECELGAVNGKPLRVHYGARKRGRIDLRGRR